MADQPGANGATDNEPDEPLQSPPWSRGKRDVAATIWPSFLVASVATMLFFAMFDPAEMGDAMLPAREIARMTGYGWGFFFFWLICAASSGLTLFLVRTTRRQRPPDEGGA